MQTGALLMPAAHLSLVSPPRPLACHQMRTELWMSQLQRRGVRSASMMGEYRDLLFEVRPSCSRDEEAAMT